MGNFFKPISGIEPMWIIVCFETLIVLGAMTVDFFSGFYKAKLRGEVRNSLGMKRTISKFILYVGSIMIACGIDSTFFMCSFWEILHFSPLQTVPVVTTFVSVFICVIEIRSIWEKAEDKQKQDALQTAEAIVKLMNKESIGEKLEDAINNIKGNNNETE
jgi:hypothetical protein